METIKLTITNMSSSHLPEDGNQYRTKPGRKVKSIAPMQAEIELSDSLSREEVISAIEKAGYKAAKL